MQALRALKVADNRLASLPPELRHLAHLRQLDASRNRLAEIHPWLGQLTGLEELSLGGNSLSNIPAELSQLQNLTVLSIPSNRLSSVPAAILKGCTALRTLDIHNNPVTVKQLREMEGWGDFDARRRAACDKLIDSRAMSAARSFDEGGDIEQWKRWG